MLNVLLHLQFAALRELFKAKQGNYSPECLSREWLRHVHLPQNDKPDNKIDTESATTIEDNNLIENEIEKPASAHVTQTGLNEEPDEFFDVSEAPEFTDYDLLENEWSTETSSKLCSPVFTFSRDQILNVIYPRDLPKF